jgi:hypothetical protein
MDKINSMDSRKLMVIVLQLPVAAEVESVVTAPVAQAGRLRQAVPCEDDIPEEHRDGVP